MNVHCFTSATFSYLDRVRVLGKSLRRHHPDWKLTFCLSDREPIGFSFRAEDEPIDRVVRIDELAIEDRQSWMFGHDIVELCTAVKGQMLCQLLDEGADKVIYIDPDIALFSPLEELLELLDRGDVVLTPHQLTPDTKKSAIIDNEIGSLKFGIYNLGFIGVSNTEEGRRFAHWWRDRLLDFCIDDVPNGLFTDQRWCDHVPSFFAGAQILRHRGYNVASWNLSQRPISIDTTGNIYAGGDVLRFFHFTKVNWVGEAMIERYAGGRVEMFELLNWYRNELAENAAEGLPEGWWAFDRYASGDRIPKEHRRAYRLREDIRQLYRNPFQLVGNELSQFEKSLGF